MPSRVCPLPPEGREWGPAKSPYGGGSAGGPAVAWCSGSVVIVTGGTNTAASAAGGKRGGANGGPPTGGTSKAGRDGSITATGNGPTENAAACVPQGSDDRAAVRAQLFTTGPNSTGYGINHINVAAGDDDEFLGPVALYTTDGERQAGPGGRAPRHAQPGHGHLLALESPRGDGPQAHDDLRPGVPVECGYLPRAMDHRLR